MSCKELIESLRKAADARIGQLWQEADKKAEASKAESARKLADLRDEIVKSREAAGREQLSQAEAEARNKARLQRLSAEKAVSDRLYETACRLLPGLRRGDYQAVFTRMAEELPDLKWKTVKVNPADVPLARGLFPGAELLPDRNISGGMDVSTADGSVRVINTFEKRLERAWRYMLPELIRDVWREVPDESPGIPFEPGIPDRVSVVQD